MGESWKDEIRKNMIVVLRKRCVDPKIRKNCKKSCMICLPEDHQCPGESSIKLFDKHDKSQDEEIIEDEHNYKDFMDEECVWYQLNDRECKLATEKTKKKCKMTCQRETLEYKTN